MKNRVLVAVAAASVAFGCDTTATRAPKGAAQLLVSMQTVCDGCGSGGGGPKTIGPPVTRVSVTITGPNITGSITHDLSLNAAATVAQGTFLEIPVSPPEGTNHFVATAYDSSSTALATGSADVPILQSQTALVVLTLQITSTDSNNGNHPPVIDSVTTNNFPTVGVQTTFTVNAHDPDTGDSISYSGTVTDNDGTFGQGTPSSTFLWTPATAANHTLTFTVTDSHSATDQISVTVAVAQATGSAGVTVNINYAPQINGMSASPDVIHPGDTTQLSLNVSDWDGDTATTTYSWSSPDCTSAFGAFNDPTAQNPTFTLNELPASGSCTLSVTVNDGNGGTTHGSILIGAVAPAQAYFAPKIVFAYQSATTVDTSGQIVDLYFQASDPQSGGTLSFLWGSDPGLGTQADTSDSTSNQWTAPACLPSSGVSLNATVTDSVSGLSTTQFFTILPSTAFICP